jgi:antirestriction protein ArdC
MAAAAVRAHLPLVRPVPVAGVMLELGCPQHSMESASMALVAEVVAAILVRTLLAQAPMAVVKVEVAVVKVAAGPLLPVAEAAAQPERIVRQHTAAALVLLA